MESQDGVSGATKNVQQRRQIEQRAIADLGSPYAALDNCETDVNRVHTGVAISPTANNVLACAVGGVVLLTIFNAFGNRN